MSQRLGRGTRPGRASSNGRVRPAGQTVMVVMHAPSAWTPFLPTFSSDRWAYCLNEADPRLPSRAAYAVAGRDNHSAHNASNTDYPKTQRRFGSSGTDT